MLSLRLRGCSRRSTVFGSQAGPAKGLAFPQVSEHEAGKNGRHSRIRRVTSALKQASALQRLSGLFASILKTSKWKVLNVQRIRNFDLNHLRRDDRSAGTLSGFAVVASIGKRTTARPSMPKSGSHCDTCETAKAVVPCYMNQAAERAARVQARFENGGMQACLLRVVSQTFRAFSLSNDVAAVCL